MAIGQPGRSAGPDVRRVRIEAVDFVAQQVTVSMPTTVTTFKIPLGLRRVRSESPRVGETWLIERTLGAQWTLAALVAPAVAPPTVTGSRAASDPLARSLLAALVALGLVEDGTSP